MGVDARYLYGYMTENDKVEFDIDFMKQNFNLNRKVNDNFYNSTYGEMIECLEKDEIDDWEEFYDSLNLKCRYVDGDGWYVCLEVTKLAELFPESQLKDLDAVKNRYLSSVGIRNPEVFTLHGFAYFD